MTYEEDQQRAIAALEHLVGAPIRYSRPDVEDSIVPSVWDVLYVTIEGMPSSASGLQGVVEHLRNVDLQTDGTSSDRYREYLVARKDLADGAILFDIDLTTAGSSDEEASGTIAGRIFFLKADQVEACQAEILTQADALIFRETATDIAHVMRRLEQIDMSAMADTREACEEMRQIAEGLNRMLAKLA